METPESQIKPPLNPNPEALDTPEKIEANAQAAFDFFIERFGLRQSMTFETWLSVKPKIPLEPPRLNPDIGLNFRARLHRPQDMKSYIKLLPNSNSPILSRQNQEGTQEDLEALQKQFLDKGIYVGI